MKFKSGYFKFLLVLFSISVIFFANPVFALEPNYELPSMLWGRASVTTKPGTSESMIYFSQPQATMAIRNTAPGTLPDFSYFAGCVLGIFDTNISCFNFNSPSSTKILNSKTYVNGLMKSAVAVMKYPSVNVIGDSFNASGNFAYWGRHLRQSEGSSSSNAFWQATNYQFNPSAQAIWSGDNQTMSNTIDRIAASAKDIDSVVTPFYGICGNTSICSEKDQYPEGRAWDFGANRDLTIAGLQYFDRAAIIVEKKKLIITSSISNPSQDSLSNLGFIVRNGDVVISNPDATKSIKINASIFAPNGTITVSGYNITLTGSFVAKNFSVPASSSNINFIEDTRGESAWPPGFRELQLPDVLSK